MTFLSLSPLGSSKTFSGKGFGRGGQRKKFAKSSRKRGGRSSRPGADCSADGDGKGKSGRERGANPFFSARDSLVNRSRGKGKARGQDTGFKPQSKDPNEQKELTRIARLDALKRSKRGKGAGISPWSEYYESAVKKGKDKKKDPVPMLVSADKDDASAAASMDSDDNLAWDKDRLQKEPIPTSKLLLKNVVPKINNVSTLAPHFAYYGTVREVSCNPEKRTATVHFEKKVSTFHSGTEFAQFECCYTMQ